MQIWPHWVAQATTITAIVLVVLGLIVILAKDKLIAPFLEKYAGKAAEIIATRNNFAEVLKQLEDQTRLTQSIQGDYHREKWRHETGWKERRDAYVVVVQRLASANDAHFEVSRRRSAQIAVEKSEAASQKLADAYKGLIEAQALVAIFGSDDMLDLVKPHKILGGIPCDPSDSEYHVRAANAFENAINRVATIARKELLPS